MEKQEKLVKLLLEKGIIKFRSEEPVEENPQIKSPMYTDFAMIVDWDEISSLSTEILASKIDQKINELGLIFDFIVGISTAGIQVGKLIAEKYDKPFTRIKSGQTYSGNSGDNNFMHEPHFVSGKKALVVEDIIYANGNMVKEVDLIRRLGASVVMGASILTYNNLDYQGEIIEKQIPLVNSLTIDEVLIICIKKEIIKPNDFEILKNFFIDPRSWYNKNFPNTAIGSN
ncbi:MAG: phosphoribosyltransferase family protein [Candidatus Paceibacterota bacterium]